MLLMQSVNGTQFLNITPLFVSYASFATSLSPASVIVIVSLTSIYHYNNIYLTLSLKF